MGRNQAKPNGGSSARADGMGRFAERECQPDSPLEGDGFEPSVPHGIGPFGRSRTGLEPDEGRRLKTEIRSPGTDSSNPALSCGESSKPSVPLAPEPEVRVVRAEPGLAVALGGAGISLIDRAALLGAFQCRRDRTAALSPERSCGASYTDLRIARGMVCQRHPCRGTGPAGRFAGRGPPGPAARLQDRHLLWLP